jgi:hypothetical protein
VVSLVIEHVCNVILQRLRDVAIQGEDAVSEI